MRWGVIDMSDAQIILIGGGGHAKVVADCARSAGTHVAGFLDDGADPALAAMGFKRLGATTDWLQVLEHLSIESRDEAILMFNAIGDNHHRREVTERIRREMDEISRRSGERDVSLWRFATIVHTSAVVSGSASIEHGALVGPAAVLNAACVISEGAVVNSGAIIEHDCSVGRFAHIAPGAVLGGAVIIGEATLVGIGARIKPGLHIGDNVTIGAGAVVCDDLADGVTVKGAPAR